MKTGKRFLAISAIALLGGCAIPDQNLGADEQNQLAPVECRGAEQCAKMWQRAQAWIHNNAAYRIQMANDVVITTFNPPENSPLLGYSVLKEPKGGDLYEINSRAGCNNMFGCRPHPNKGRAALHRYIRETPP